MIDYDDSEVNYDVFENSNSATARWTSAISISRQKHHKMQIIIGEAYDFST